MKLFQPIMYTFFTKGPSSITNKKENKNYPLLIEAHPQQKQQFPSKNDITSYETLRTKPARCQQKDLPIKHTWYIKRTKEYSRTKEPNQR